MIHIHKVVSEKSNMIFMITPRNSPTAVIGTLRGLRLRREMFRFLRSLSKSRRELTKTATETGKDSISLYPQMLNPYPKMILCPTISYLSEI